ncbi:flavodoxin family protein [Clostridium botulinum]|uniref:Flavodoxin family protein n=1 Tax=Clostridium botulinum TaxID=1491 RepID=A0A6G4ECZ7_CLOBO|nr:flavodoxin family protein [Clostridium botulinum]APH18767.1 NADPH-dependent FMN reductase family protein [Clostridium botulinum]AUM91596.1 NADPH-dependent FMN reductase [Clostridium botulinum]NFB12996.1 flavodoxin family protein [Clostridium botulinum]NFH57926.1 flavodoxin family protein [Clostridium botulinum]NFH61111.1 flavodoxin family protein [Clostridium botulinum]
MKVLLINGSPKAKGCTYTALCEIAKELEKENIETEIFHIGNKPIRGCMACGGCYKNKSGKCVFDDDTVNMALEKAKEADGFIFGSPVHYAAASGQITSFLDRFFYAGDSFQYKPGAAIVSCRRGGSTTAFDQLNKYFTISNMPIVSSQYWNMVHGNTPEEVKQDLEGMQTMRVLGKNMAWLLKSINAGKEAGVSLPEKEPRAWTNFIR